LKQSFAGADTTNAACDEGCASRASLERVAKWSKLASNYGFSDFISPEDGFKTCLQSGRNWTNKDQPGIYFWLATDGEAYVGQSIKPQSRLRQHLRDHRYVSHACFMPCAPHDLNQAEEKLITQIGKHFPLRNIKHAVTTSSEVPFDKLISDDERERFLAGENLPDEPWRDLPLLTRLQNRKFDKFAAVEGGLEALAAASTFVHRAIPMPAATEVGFWSITLFPANCFLRVNAGQQEVFTCAGGRNGSEARILTDKRVRLLRSRDSGYRVASYVTAMAPSRVSQWLRGEALLSCRRLVVRLMRHTTTLNSGSHCPQAVRADVKGA
jgi:hypothetical protein